ncbi:MAG: phage major capsid protein [Acetobacteraceae bacterium]
MAVLQDLREKQQKLVVDARAKLDEIKDDTPEARAKEIETEYDRLMAEYDRLEERCKREEDLARRAAENDRPDPRRPNQEDRTAPPPGDPKETPEAREKAYAEAFRNMLCFGRENLPPEQRALLNERQSAARAFLGSGEVRAQGVAIGSQGGDLVPAGFMPELSKAMKAYGPMLDALIVREMVTATGGSIGWPTMDDTSNKGARIAENQQVSVAEVQFGTRTLNAYKYTSGVVLVATELLSDSPMNVEQIVRDAMGERLGRIGNEELTTGTGGGMPNGVAVAAAAGATAAAGTAITFDDLMDLEHSVDPAYRVDPSCRWMFNDGTLKALRKLKNGEGDYIWQTADVKAGTPSLVLNYPYSINQNMPSVATTNRSVLFGAFSRYIVRKVNQLVIRRLVERYADFDQTGFIGFMRFDGNLIDAGAIKALTHP